MRTIYIDADACPVKDEVYRVARRYGLRVAVVANAPLRVPADELIGLVVRPGFGAADDWIAGQAGLGDIVVTADIPLALADEDSEAFLPGNFQVMAAMFAALPRLAECFRTGAGLGWGEQDPLLFEGGERSFG